MAELFVSNDKDILNPNTVTFEEREKLPLSSAIFTLPGALMP